MLRVLRRSFVLAIVIGALVMTQRSSSAHDATEVRAGRVSVLESGELVVSLDTHGTFPGLLTAKLAVSADGTISGGEWAVVVTLVEDLNPDGSVDTTHEHVDESVPHQEFIRITDRGTINGAITGGLATVAADGSLVLSNLQLTIQAGSLTYESVTAGTGTLDANLGVTDAQGTLRLHF